jgi:hypothetical protein
MEIKMLRARNNGFLSSLLPLATLLLVFACGCERDSDTEDIADFPTDPEVYIDDFGDDVTYAAFLDSYYEALSIEYNDTYNGSAALKVAVPADGNPDGVWAGGAFPTNSVKRDLSDYNALTFWAKASADVTIGLFGIGNDNTGFSLYTTEWNDVPVSTTWTQYYIPMPLPDMITREQGLFHYSTANNNGEGFDLYLDEIYYTTTDLISDPSPVLMSQTVEAGIGSEVEISGSSVSFDVGGNEQVLSIAPALLTYFSSDESVALITESNAISIVGPGMAVITAKLGDVDAEGSVVINTFATPAEPPVAPTQEPSDVLSLFSNAYDDVTVDHWSTDWDMADVEDVTIDGDDTKLYTNFTYAAIELTTSPLDFTDMTFFHLDFWVFDDSEFKVKLVDFGSDGVYGGDDDSEGEITLSADSNPEIAVGTWNSLDIPVSNFSGLSSREHLAQIIISGSSPTVYMDNIYFYLGELPDSPEAPAPSPEFDESLVISLFSNAYSDVNVDTWSADWDVAEVEDVQIAGDDMKHYYGVEYVGIEFTSETIDASAMNGFHMDLWTSNPVADPVEFKIKLVDFGADGGFGGDDDVEHELSFNASTSPALLTGQWISFDIPLDYFSGMSTRDHIAQLILSGGLSDFYIDNILFYYGDSEDVPTPEVGSLGVYTDTTPVNRQLVIEEDAFIYVWEGTLVSGDIEPFEGENVISWTTTGTGWFGAGIASVDPVNLINFVDGYLNFMIQIPADVSFKIGIVDTWGVENYVDFPANTTTHGLVRDGSWGQASIPVSLLRGSVDLQMLNYEFTILEVNGAQCEFAIDDIYWHDGN